MAGRFSIETVFKAVDKMTAPVTRIQNRVGKFTRSAERNFRRLNRSVNKFGAGIKKMALGATVALAAIGAGLHNLILIGADFGRAIGSAAVKFPEDIKRGTAAFKELERAARDVGAATEFTAVQAAQGLNFLAKAGFSAKFSVAALGDIVDFATASEIEFAEAADIASDALGSFGLNSKNIEKRMTGLRRVMDVMSLTANSSNVSVAELFESVKDGGPIAAAAGVSIETFAATMGFLANSGIKASKAGTASKAITLALAGVGNKAAGTFKRLGINLADSNGNLRDQFDVLDDLRSRISKLSQIKQIAITEAIFGKRSISAAAKLLDKSGEGVRGFRIELEKANGSSKRTAQFIRGDVKGSIDSLKSAIEGVKVSIFSLNKGPLKEAIDKMTKWVRANEAAIATGIGEFFLHVVDNMGPIVTWLKRIGKGVLVFVALSAVLKTFIGVMTAVNIVMALNPIGLIVIAVAALIAGFTALVVWVDEVAAAFGSMPAVLRLALAPLELMIQGIKFIKDNLGGIVSAVASLGGIFDSDNDEQPARQAGPRAAGRGRGPASIASRQQDKNSESLVKTSAEVTLRDETGRAELTRGRFGRGITMQSSGGF